MNRWAEWAIWRIGFIEKAFFLFVRWFYRDRVLPKAFTDVFGFDISKWQGAVDFAKMQAYGTKFIILRASYGITTDQRFHEYMKNSAAYFPRVAVYHYYDPIHPPSDQAKIFLKAIEPYRNRIVRAYGDMEFPWSGDYIAPQFWKIFRDAVKQAGYGWGWYTRATWWDSRVGTYATEFAKDPCWAAQYNNVLDLIPKGWTKAMIWQMGTPSIGYAAGVSSAEIDYDLWNDEFDFEAEWGDLPPPPPGGTMYYGQVKVFTNIRNTPPGGTYTDIGDLNAGDMVVADEVRIVNTYPWWHLTGWSRNGQALTLPGANCWAYGVNIQEVAAPPPQEVLLVEEVVDFVGKTVTLKYSNGTTRTEKIG